MEKSKIIITIKQNIGYLRPAVRTASGATFQDTAQARRRQVLSVICNSPKFKEMIAEPKK